jgi:hypothetical protein
VAEGAGNAPVSAVPILFSGQMQPVYICLPSEKRQGAGWLHYPLYTLHLIVPAHAISTKNKHLLVIYSIPARGFTAAVSVFGGTPPPKPLICKLCFAASGASLSRSWAHHVGDQPTLVLAKFNLSPKDITWMSLFSYSQTGCISSVAVTLSLSRENKKPRLRFGKQGD